MDKQTAEMLRAKKLAAKMRAQEIQKKRRPLQESGYVRSQWEGLTGENRLLEMGFYKRTKRAYNRKKKESDNEAQREKIAKQKLWLMAVNKML